MCYQTCQKGNRLPCPYPYVSKVMFHDIHPDSDTCQPEVLALFPCTSIWTTTTSDSWKTGRREGVETKSAKYDSNSLYWLYRCLSTESSIAEILLSYQELCDCFEGCNVFSLKSALMPHSFVFGCSLSSFLSVQDRSAGKTRGEITEETEREREKPFCPCHPINFRRTRKCQQD